MQIDLLSALATTLLASGVTFAFRLAPGTAQRNDAVDEYGGQAALILQHPADWSRDVYPIPVHSHNDYWRDAPILDALSHGVRSMESDVWLNPDDEVLYVGHDPFALSPLRTFQSLTLAPLKRAIDQANEANHIHSDSSDARFFASLQQQDASSVNRSHPFVGYFSGGVGLSAPLQLLIDIKTDGDTTFPHILRELQPLADGGYLTQYDAETDTTTPGPLLIIGTGNTPAATLAAMDRRFIFLDCPLGKLDPSVYDEGDSVVYNASVCALASTDLESLVPTWQGLNDPTDDQRRNLTAAIDQAHTLNIKTRIWDTPNWPIYARDRVNKVLLEIGSDWINADDLGAIATF